MLIGSINRFMACKHSVITAQQSTRAFALVIDALEARVVLLACSELLLIVIKFVRHQLNDVPCLPFS